MTRSLDTLEWEELDASRERARHPAGFTIVRPKIRSGLGNMPFECPVCHEYMRLSDDIDAYNEFKCCSRCANRWAYPNRDKWLEGWRPDDAG